MAKIRCLNCKAELDGKKLSDDMTRRAREQWNQKKPKFGILFGAAPKIDVTIICPECGAEGPKNFVCAECGQAHMLWRGKCNRV